MEKDPFASHDCRDRRVTGHPCQQVANYQLEQIRVDEKLYRMDEPDALSGEILADERARFEIEVDLQHLGVVAAEHDPLAGTRIVDRIGQRTCHEAGD